MTGIYLVEDEIYALKALQQKIIDLEEDYTIIGTADNGITALEQIPQLCPDIVFTDIRMPDMDGLTLILKLAEAGCNALFVVVSGYQDFEYAKQAVRLGAIDYLLKPVSPDELRSCLKRCAENLQKRRKNIISFLIGAESLSFENIPGQDSFTLLYLIVSNPLSNVENPLHPNTAYLPNPDVEQLFRHCHSCQFWRCYDGFFSNEKLLLLNGDEKSNRLLAADLPHFMHALEDMTHKSITLYHARTSRSSLPSAIRECRNNAVHNVILGKSTLCCGSPRQLPAATGLQETAELFALLINQGQFELLHSNINRLFMPWIDDNRSCMAIWEDLLFIMDLLKRKLTSPKKYTDFSNQYFLENIMSFSADNAELAENFYLLLITLFSSGEPETKPADELVESIINYFSTHLSSNVTLQELEEKTGFSKVYICRVFKKLQNTSPIDYFTRLKINRAQELLVEYPSLSLREISDSLGFNDVYYFSKVFKRITGSSPSEMRALKLSSPTGVHPAAGKPHTL